MTEHTKTIAESNNFIVLNKYTKCDQPDGGYQTEDDLERELLKDLQNQGYEYLSIHNEKELIANLKDKLEKLNNIIFSEKNKGVIPNIEIIPTKEEIFIKKDIQLEWIMKQIKKDSTSTKP